MKKTPKHATNYAPLFPYLGGELGQGKLVIDNFAGAGGASLGIEMAIGRPVDHAINHDPTALGLHRLNHPHSHHSIEDVWQVNPRKVARGQDIILAWNSPTCTHFSKAKGAALLDRKIRGLAWVLLRWTALTNVNIAITENVEEFRDWGPLLPDGRPDPKQKGRTFNSWVNALRRQGYEVEYRELRACDYGTPTIRKRLFVIARKDGLPIVWPEPTHAAPNDPRVQAGVLKPYRTAAECIDWDLPCPSIFDRKKPLVRNTLNRVAQGLRRFVLESPQPFLVNKQHQNPPRSVDAPLSTITTNHNKNELIQPALAPVLSDRMFGRAGQAANTPLPTITTTHNKTELLAAHLTKFNTGSVGQGVSDPIATITAGGTPARESTGNTHGLVAAQLVTYYGRKSETEVRGQDGSEPLRTQTTENRHALATAHLIQHNGGTLPPAHANYPATNPARTVLASGGPQGLVSGALIKTDNQRSRTSCTYPLTGQVPTIVTENNQALVAGTLVGIDNASSTGSTWPAGQPLTTIVTEARHAAVSGALVACGGRGAQARPKALDECMHTITSKADMCLTSAHLTAYYSRGGQHDDSRDADTPLGTVPTVDRFSVTAATLMRQFGTSTAADIEAPAPTVMTEGAGKTGVIAADCVPTLTAAQFARAREVHDFLAEYLGDALLPYSHGGLVVLQVRGEWYVLADIGMRMLTPRELARCQGFPDSYVLDRTPEGQPIPKSKQVRAIGNSVCPQVAEALVRAQLSAQLPQAAD
ncbi:hypothetical protein GO986_17755 [Deinococcus sp. HMF7620]|uniref:DNA (cytosine-5-)-methyltransferase n=1 Tax=Deinococcus arboris TaxID=2682977 RepID=A0A7C9MT30_9DEIO|nr:DNA cytosine methyltransferase [Deinococcus arboris]MVN88584.1 hypothetical protein [Deinococcus arboris]